MTALIAALGLVPLLLATGVGSEIQQALATVVVEAGICHAAHTARHPGVIPVVFARLAARESPGRNCAGLIRRIDE